MFAVQDDWIQYEGVPARRPVVRGGAACAQRIPVVRAVPSPPRRTVVAVPRPVAPSREGARPLRLTRRGRVVLVVLPGLLAASGALVAVTGAAAAQPAAAQPAARSVVAGAGDTSQSVARRVAPAGEPHHVAAVLGHRNGPSGTREAADAVRLMPAHR